MTNRKESIRLFASIYWDISIVYHIRYKLLDLIARKCIHEDTIADVIKDFYWKYL